jgi:uncharacterized RDD family membrane protein YckC
VNCPKCSASLPNNLLLCPACGHNLRSTTAPLQTSSLSPVVAPFSPGGATAPQLHSGANLGPVSPATQFVAAPAGFWLRVAACLLDYVVTYSVAFALGIFFALGGAVGMGVIFAILINWFYEAGMTASRFQGTLGKRVVGLKVLTNSGEQLTFGKATGRYFLKCVLWLVTLGLITIPAGIRKDKKTGYDLLLDSTVFRR